MTPLAYPLIALLLTASQGATYTGRLESQPVGDGRMVMLDFTPSNRTDIPDRQPDDRLFSVRVGAFKTADAPAGLEILILESKNGARIYADRNLDGTFTSADKVADLADIVGVSSWTHTWDLPAAGGTMLAIQNRIERSKSGTWVFMYSPTYRLNGHVEIGGRRTLVSLPFKIATGKVDVSAGYIGVDGDGDGKIDTTPLSPEYVAADGTPPVFRIGERYVAIESADFTARSFVVKERQASDYKLIEVRTGAPLPDFSFTDFDGRTRTLSEFRGKWVLIDIWGSWCKPCVEDVPMMKEAYERFQPKGFEIVGLDYEMQGTAEKVRPFLKEKDVRWVNGTPESVRELVSDRFQVNSFPTLLLIDPKGNVADARSGALRGTRLIATLERLIR
jgi:thiol-disulfide isomerase/thioredoxin